MSVATVASGSCKDCDWSSQGLRVVSRAWSNTEAARLRVKMSVVRVPSDRKRRLRRMTSLPSSDLRADQTVRGLSSVSSATVSCDGHACRSLVA